MPMQTGGPRCAAGLAVAVAALASASPAAADPAPPYEVLLERLDSSPAGVQAQALYDAAEARARQARALPNPSLTLEAENVYGSGPWSGFDAAETTLAIEQPLELWGRRGARIRAAGAEAGAARLRRDQAHWQAAARLALAYAEAEAAVLRHELASEALSLTEEDTAAAKALVEEGREPALRAIQAESELAEARSRLARAGADRDAALARLTALTLLENAVTSVPFSLLERVPAAASALVEEPLAVQVAAAEADAARRMVAVEERRARPDVAASLGVRRFEESGDDALTLGLSLSLPVFDRNRGGIAAALAERRAAEARLEERRLEVLAEQRAAGALLAASGDRIRATEAGVAAAEEAYRLARIGFDAGRIARLELRSARTALIAARSAATDARLARVHAEVDLARLEGRAPFGETP